MAEKDIHYYEPASGHGLKHDPFNAIVAPRPIGWISSRDAKGNINLAPYSFFNAFCYKPPIVGFSSTSWKDSVSNIQETKEFCWNLAIMDLAKQMNATSAQVAHDVNEFTIAGLTATPSKIVNSLTSWANLGRGRVHLLGEIHDREIPAELLSLLDVRNAVLQLVEESDRRLIAKRVEKKLYGARLILPLASREEIQPIGRGATMALKGSCFNPSLGRS